MAKRPLNNDKSFFNDEKVANYFHQLSGFQLSEMLAIRDVILKLLPNAVESIKYQMPTYSIGGKAVCGILANKKHIGYYPYSGSILSELPEITQNYTTTPAAWHIPYGAAVPSKEIKAAIDLKLKHLKL
ncbi:MAG: hypothetical protein RL038_1294 [Actinomycetota bacterium]|jgi:uncharacterized protein YdhG (YjbR/CyaY superfamily)